MGNFRTATFNITRTQNVENWYVFVTPPIDGWALAVGSLPDPSAAFVLPHWRQLMAQVGSLGFGVTLKFLAQERISCHKARPPVCYWPRASAKLRGAGARTAIRGLSLKPISRGIL